MDPRVIQVEIVLALPDRAHSLTLKLGPSATVAEAVDRAALSGEFHEADLNATVGIFGRIVGRDHVLKHGDRIEIYRPLAADPKTARRQRVASKSGRS